jgi:sulfite reductase beta subunit-like hemoprotein
LSAVSLRTPRDGAAADRCPGALRLHEAGDGWLARIRVPGGRLSPDRLTAVAEIAGHGNGLVDLTSRANLQVRGLAAGDTQRIAALLAAAGLLPSPAHDRVRNIIASPVAGRHPRSVTDTDPIVGALDRALCADELLVRLPSRFLFAVDDGSGFALAPRADVTILARDANAFRIALGDRAAAAPLSPERAVATALAAARTFVELSGAASRIGDLPGGPRPIAARLGLDLDANLPASTPSTVGLLRQRDGRCAVTGLARLGRVDRLGLRALAALALAQRSELRLSPARTLTLTDLEGRAVADAGAGLADAGLELSPESGWSALTACAGLGSCPRARADVRAAAMQRARVRGAGAAAEHWSACERRCGERPEQPVAVAVEGDRLTVRVGSAETSTANIDDALAVLA